MCVGGKHIRKKVTATKITGIKLLKFNLNLCVTQYEIYKTINKKVIKKETKLLRSYGKILNFKFFWKYEKYKKLFNI